MAKSIKSQAASFVNNFEFNNSIIAEGQSGCYASITNAIPEDATAQAQDYIADASSELLQEALVNIENLRRFNENRSFGRDLSAVLVLESEIINALD